MEDQWSCAVTSGPGFSPQNRKQHNERSTRWASQRPTRVPVPQLVAADIDGSHVGDGIAAILTAFAPGVARAVPDLRSLAAVAASIHAVDASTFTHTYFPWYQER